MTLRKSIYLAAVAAGLLFAGEGAALAANNCLAQVKALAPTVENLADMTVKEKAEKLLKTAETEATEEFDEDECMDALKDAKELLGVK